MNRVGSKKASKLNLKRSGRTSKEIGRLITTVNKENVLWYVLGKHRRVLIRLSFDSLLSGWLNLFREPIQSEKKERTIEYYRRLLGLQASNIIRVLRQE